MKALFATSIILILSALPALAGQTARGGESAVADAASRFKAQVSSSAVTQSFEQFTDKQSVSGQQVSFGDVTAQLSGTSLFSTLEGVSTEGQTAIELFNSTGTSNDLTLAFNTPVKSFGFKAVDVKIGLSSLNITLTYQDGTSYISRTSHMVYQSKNFIFWGFHSDKAIQSVSIDRTDVNARMFLDEFIVITDDMHDAPKAYAGLYQYQTDACQSPVRNYYDAQGAIAIKTPLDGHRGHVACIGSLRGNSVTVVRMTYSANRFLGGQSTDYCYVYSSYRNVSLRINDPHWAHEMIDGKKISTLTMSYTHHGQFPHKPYGSAGPVCRFADPEADNLKLISGTYSLYRDTL
ncbi:hypothetical protein [Pseudoalteromonas umbrosa]|uniref:hypothetical protein n=1 Tax=Pseudoalteromonas umbrosa TaxID=3048489 RepID=UPI0024C21671|nr:hypothetical protein [Pseudoalteromonas sp. B95]MDK1290139.1 hypothetical protein [Pseudoalteromonas sp. B95]